MFNLVIKDLKMTVPAAWVIAILWAFMLINSHGKGFPFLGVSILLIFQPLLVDDKNKMESVFVSLPVKRSDIVIGRYLGGLSLLAINITLTFLGGIALNGVAPETFKKIIPIESILGPQVVVVFLMVLMYPIFFKFGAYLDAGMKVVAIVLSAALLLAFLIMIFLNNLNIDLFRIKNILLYMILLSLSLLFLSCLLSLRIFRRREF
jgi:hypothetical protein